ncbi:hypothetical protein IM543_19175 [Massilia sp. UMI-21]|nr:hypothetical protein IM543_19175 [Massilia sp. UMI-21]
MGEPRSAPMNALRRIHRLSALAVGAYALVHLANHLVALQGVEHHIAFMGALRQVTRLSAVEALLLAAVLVQVVSGLLLARGRPRAPRAAPRPFLARLQAMSGLYLAFFLVVHVGSVMVGRSVLGLDTNFCFAAAGLLVAPYYLFFVPYYGLAVAAFVLHLACAMRRLLPAGAGPAWSRRIGYAGIVGGVVLAALIVAAFSGAFHPIALPPAYLATFR